MKPDARIIELCERLTSPGPIQGKLSASEHHEICDFIFELHEQCKSAKPLTASDIMEIARDGDDIPPLRALATFASVDNWVQIYEGKTSSGQPYVAHECEWAFIGPVRPPYELAQNALACLTKKTPWDFKGEAE